VTTVLLVRHGRTTANASGVLAGWSEGVDLDAEGQEQARRLKDRWASLRLDAVVSSPLQRCRTTAELARADHHPDTVLDDDLGECHYGEWTGRTLASLGKDPLWKVVQQHPSAATFPGGESLRAMQTRGVEAIRRWNAQLPKDAVYAVFSHGDVIKAILADALGLHLDQFQRIVVDPGSVSVIRYTPLRPFVDRTNSMAGDLAGLRPMPSRRRRRRGAESDAAVGGGDGDGG
jgi:probable phosphomutase (TIGR03848 family)